MSARRLNLMQLVVALLAAVFAGLILWWLYGDAPMAPSDILAWLTVLGLPIIALLVGGFVGLAVSEFRARRREERDRWLRDEFMRWGEAPPPHPNCRCVITDVHGRADRRG